MCEKLPIVGFRHFHRSSFANPNLQLFQGSPLPFQTAQTTRSSICSSGTVFISRQGWNYNWNSGYKSNDKRLRQHCICQSVRRVQYILMEHFYLQRLLLVLDGWWSSKNSNNYWKINIVHIWKLRGLFIDRYHS